MRVKLVIFDFDGTLADSLPWFISAINGAAAKYHFDTIDPNEVEPLRQTDALTLLRGHGIPRWKLPLVVRYMRRLMSRNIGQIRLFKGIDTMLRELSAKGVALAIVSSNARKNIIGVLGECADLIRHYECGVSMSGKTAKILKLLSRAGVLPGDALYIGDEIRDGEAARKAGVSFGAVSWGYNSIESLRSLSPALEFGAVDEIVRKII